VPRREMSLTLRFTGCEKEEGQSSPRQAAHREGPGGRVVLLWVGGSEREPRGVSHSLFWEDSGKGKQERRGSGRRARVAPAAARIKRVGCRAVG
jgi:hypothetical protein